MMLNTDEEKNRLITALSDKYSENLLSIEEYERLLEYINKIETAKEFSLIEKLIAEHTEYVTEVTSVKGSKDENKKEHLSIFSSQILHVKPVNGNAGDYTCLFGDNKIMIDNLPRGKTVLNVTTVFGSTTLLVSKYVKIINKTTAVFAGIFAPVETNESYENSGCELHIKGDVVFGNITIQRI